jgi:hypothetical protein
MVPGRLAAVGGAAYGGGGMGNWMEIDVAGRLSGVQK